MLLNHVCHALSMLRVICGFYLRTMIYVSRSDVNVTLDSCNVPYGEDPQLTSGSQTASPCRNGMNLYSRQC